MNDLDDAASAGRGVPSTTDAPELEARLRLLLADPPVERALRRIRDEDELTLRVQAELTEIPAPPFGEEARGDRVAELLQTCGLEPWRDDEGNVLAAAPGGRSARGAPLLVAAHLDTIFPTGTDVTVRREGDRLCAPGISDDGRGLAALVTLARAVSDADGALPLPPLLFVATVGEEGAGDLRGVRHVFRDGGPGRDARAFVALDGAGLRRIVTAGLGSLRYRIVLRGPGGHSWVDWGAPNPIHALGRLVADAASLRLPAEPATTLTVARWSGGTSINAIPAEAWVEVEVRSESGEELRRLDGELRRMAALAAGGYEASRALRLQVMRIGDRPAGGTAADHPLVGAAVAATRSVGAEPELALSSTDANVPMALGVPAVTMGAGGEAGGAHTTGEWYRNEKGPDGIARALLTMLLAADLEGPTGA